MNRSFRCWLALFLFVGSSAGLVSPRVPRSVFVGSRVMLIPPKGVVGSFLHQSCSFLELSATTEPFASDGKVTRGDVYEFCDKDLRGAAMKLHKRSKESSREDKVDTNVKGISGCTLQNYRCFLETSLQVYQALEDVTSKDERYLSLMEGGHARVKGIKADLQHFDQIGVTAGPDTGPDEVGQEYAQFLTDLSRSSPPRFLCHYYNHYFAHTAGGMQIGNSLRSSILQGRQLEFYKYPGSVRDVMDDLKLRIDEMYETMSEEEKELAREETGNCFGYGGRVLGSLFR